MKRKYNYRYKRPAKGRFLIILSFFVVCLATLLTRLFYLQIIENRRYIKFAENNRTATIKLSGERGVILDRNLNRLVLNVPKYSVYAVPRHIGDKPGTAEYLAEVLGRNKAAILKKLSTDKLFVWIARKLPAYEIQQIRSRGLTGIDFIIESERSYPGNSLAAHILGFVDIDNNGLEGIERYYDKELRGIDGYKVVLVDAKRRQVSLADNRFLPPRDGRTLVLAEDEAIQHIAEKALLAGVEKFHPKSAGVVVMDPLNGDILALCNWPNYNLNDYSDSSADERRNRIVTDLFEPGSAFKVVTASAALEEHVVGLNDEFYCENGFY
ncbi:MAG: penicillin-binding transpeptidase domain-containing protein, partial [Candidatus Omnitrophota bacterium]|nr:penicillin-binding transpeptidase domain-containing protein [Candidatus Omnitrophota bacterium]